MEERNREIAGNILKQLGGTKFICMVGAKDIAFGEGSIQFKFMRGKGGVNSMIIQLEENDTYTITFYKIKKFDCDEIKKLELVYADQLQEIFRNQTGLDTSL